MLDLWGSGALAWSQGAHGQALEGAVHMRLLPLPGPSHSGPPPGDRAQTYSESGGGKFLEPRARSAQRLSQGTVEGGLRGPPVQLRPSSPHPSGQTFPAGLIP